MTPPSDQHRLVERCLFLLLFLTCLFNAWSIHQVDPYEYLRNGGDALGYYQWLPGVIIEHDVTVMYWGYWIDPQHWLSLFTFGVALLQLPFFLLGHMSACFFGYPVNGFSAPYAVWQLVGSSFYAAAGSVLAYRLAARFSDRVPALLATLVVFMTSNLYFYSVQQPKMSHVYSYFLVGLFAYCAVRMLDTGTNSPPRPKHVALLVISGAWLVLVRQLNAMVFLFPLVLALGSPAGITGFVRAVTAHRTALIIGLVIAILPWSLQMAYWHQVTGEWLTFTYGKKGEHFEFGKMVPGMLLTSVRNGWWVYSPIMLPICVTLLVHAWRGTKPARAITPVLVALWLLYSAWWCWWLGGSFGIRAMVDIYALLTIPAAWMLRSVLNRPLFVRLVAALVVVFLFKLNVGLSERYEWGWSGLEWTWQHFFERVNEVVTE